MSFRTRLTLAAAAAVAIAVVAASAITYALVRYELRDGVDETLQRRAEALPALRILGDPQGGQFVSKGRTSASSRSLLRPPATRSRLPARSRKSTTRSRESGAS